MSYTELTQFNSPNYTPNSQVRAVFGMARTIESITIHWWGDPNQNPSFEGVVSWLCRANGSSSAHTVATGTGKRAAWIVNSPDAAWHSGNARGNATSIGIECDPRARAEDYDVVAELIADIWIAYGVRFPLVPHKSWSQTACPGNYDLNRLNVEADAWFARKKNPTPTPPPTPAVKETSRENYNPVKRFKITQNCILENIPNGGNAGTRTYPAGEELDIAQKLTMSDGSVWYRTPYSASKELGTGFRAQNVAEVVVAPPQPEWIRNLKDITDVKLTVLPAAGTRVVNLNTLQPVNDTILPKGTQIDIAKETTVGGNKYLISSYAANGNVSNGILASDLGVPVTPPVQEKPEWLKNLKDIEDQDFWTRSETPVLKLEDGSTVKRLPINTKVRITHATEIVGNNIMVLDGQTEGIETIYLSDKPIENPNDDVEKRLTALEKIVKVIVDFLSGLFKNFKV